MYRKATLSLCLSEAAHICCGSKINNLLKIMQCWAFYHCIWGNFVFSITIASRGVNIFLPTVWIQIISHHCPGLTSCFQFANNLINLWFVSLNHSCKFYSAGIFLNITHPFTSPQHQQYIGTHISYLSKSAILSRIKNRLEWSRQVAWKIMCCCLML